MIKSLNEFKKYKLSLLNKLNENDFTITNDENIDRVKDEFKPPTDNNLDMTTSDNTEISEVDRIVNYAMSLELSKPETMSVVTTMFLDPAQIPDDMSIIFVQDNLSEIINKLESKDESEFGVGFNFDTELNNGIIYNDLPFECVMYAKDNDNLKKLNETLNSKIKNKDFICTYKNDIFFINSLNILSEQNKNIVMTVLKENNAKNISNIIKWKRKIK
jgi:hypothetical protein